MKGFAGQQKLGPQEYTTVIPTGSNKYALDVAPKAIFPTTGTPLAIVSTVYEDFNVDGLKIREQRLEITAPGS